MTVLSFTPDRWNKTVSSVVDANLCRVSLNFANPGITYSLQKWHKCLFLFPYFRDWQCLFWFCYCWDLQCFTMKRCRSTGKNPCLQRIYLKSVSVPSLKLALNLAFGKTAWLSLYCSKGVSHERESQWQLPWLALRTCYSFPLMKIHHFKQRGTFASVIRNFFKHSGTFAYFIHSFFKQSGNFVFDIIIRHCRFFKDAWVKFCSLDSFDSFGENVFLTACRVPPRVCVNCLWLSLFTAGWIIQWPPCRFWLPSWLHSYHWWVSC